MIYNANARVLTKKISEDKIYDRIVFFSLFPANFILTEF